MQVEFEIDQAIRYLSGETKGEVVLAYDPKLPEGMRWFVECEFCARRYPVPDTHSGTAARALTLAVYKWQNRHEFRPFMGLWERPVPGLNGQQGGS
jgi:hypothetical protein